MLVGEVRWAVRATGASCTLSGGSQWSSGPTCASNQPRVQRPRPRLSLSLGGVGRGRAELARPRGSAGEAVRRAGRLAGGRPAASATRCPRGERRDGHRR